MEIYLMNWKNEKRFITIEDEVLLIRITVLTGDETADIVTKDKNGVIHLESYDSCGCRQHDYWDGGYEIRPGTEEFDRWNQRTKVYGYLWQEDEEEVDED